MVYDGYAQFAYDILYDASFFPGPDFVHLVVFTWY